MKQGYGFVCQLYSMDGGEEGGAEGNGKLLQGFQDAGSNVQCR